MFSSMKPIRLRLTLILCITLVGTIDWIAGRQPQSTALFLGDSIFVGWEDLGGVAAENGAVAGYTSYDVLFRYHSRCIDQEYVTCVVLIGGTTSIPE